MLEQTCEDVRILFLSVECDARSDFSRTVVDHEAAVRDAFRYEERQPRVVACKNTASRQALRQDNLLRQR